ncbi:MAG: FAD-dependent oxidoreductase [Fimbriimonadaceae bacterium]|nr:FAD-dependent oxidoreductase [Fimbriimonadaceae bacterium]
MRIAVVGAGAAGLWTATLLQRAGLDVAVFEARNRVGGRLYTFEDGELAFEAGGEWIDADHERCLQICQAYELEPEPSHGWPGRVVYQGQWSNEVELWSDALEDELRLDAAAHELIRNLEPEPWKNWQAEDLDNTSLGDFVRTNCQSERGKWWLTNKYRSDEGDELGNISLLGWLCGYMHYVDRESDAMSAYRVPGGIQRLLEKIAEDLHGPLYLGKTLRRVDNHDDEVILHFDDGIVKCDRAVLALPPRTLEQIVFTPALTTGKRCAIEACPMSRIVKIAMAFESPWWEELDWTGRLHCDSKLQQIWNGTRGEVPVLNAYICGDDAVWWAQQDNAARIAAASLAEYFPIAKEEYVRGWTFDWASDPYCYGGFSHMSPGYALGHMKHIATSEDRIHFAGEHTALWTGFIEGAFESAERVAAEVIHA